MWLIPTRGRPEACRALIEAMQAVGDVPEVAVMIDDDPAKYADVPWPAHWHVHVASAHMELTGAVNALFDLYPNRPFYGVLGDHARPKTPGWSAKLEQEAGDWNIAYCDDGWMQGRRQDQPWLPHITGALCIGGKLADALGWLFLPGTVHLYVDDALEAIGERLGLLRYRPDILVAADRPETTGAARDANHQRVFHGRAYAEADRRAFETFRDVDLKGVVRRIALVSGRASIETPVAFACVKVGTKFTSDWVNRLVDMIRRHLPEAYKAKLVCLTDDIEGLDQDIHTYGVEPGLDGWWAKLRLFSDTTFREGARVIYFDLDSLVVDEIDALLSYRGPLALLRDFYRPDGLGSGVMLWRAGEAGEIWDMWNVVGRPLVEGGDQAWIEQIRPNAQRLQDLFPGALVSYKAHCTMAGPPAGAKVVCFHGEPKNDTAPDQWVADFWKIGGASGVMLNLAPNTGDADMLANVRVAVTLGLSSVSPVPAHDGQAVICGGGPSLAETIGDVKRRQEIGQTVVALNGAAKFLVDHGVMPDIQVVLDARPSNATFVAGPWALSRCIASVCAPEVFAEAMKHEAPVSIFHPVIDGIDAAVPDPSLCLIGGGITVGLTALALMHTLGYRKLHLHGYDSSNRESATHAYEQERTKQEAWQIEVVVAGRKFVTTPAMLKQAQVFPEFATALAEADTVITVAGDGLLPHIAREMQRQIMAAEAA